MIDFNRAPRQTSVQAAGLMDLLKPVAVFESHSWIHQIKQGKWDVVENLDAVLQGDPLILEFEFIRWGAANRPAWASPNRVEVERTRLFLSQEDTTRIRKALGARRP